MKVFYRTYGCTYNLADTGALQAAAEEAGHKTAGSAAEADVIVINTCGVKDATEQKILYELKRLADQERRVLVTGCLAQASPARIARANPEASIMGVHNQGLVLEALEKTRKGTRTVNVTVGPRLETNPRPTGVVHAIRISQGCAGACSFCQTKLARGRVKSVRPREVVEDAKNAIDAGARELRLTSQDTGCYGCDLGDARLPDLLGEICEIGGDFRIRVGMINPQHVLSLGGGLVEAFADEKVYKFIHAPLQSGSDGVLKAMKRGYSVDEFKTAVRRFRRRFSRAFVETDVITGFPTETDDDFQQTLDVMEETRFNVTNVSRFSPRPGTAASRMKQLPIETINSRTAEASTLARLISSESLAALVGRREKVLVTEKAREGLIARTNSYHPVIIPEKAAKPGDFAMVEITGAGRGHLKGIAE